MKNASRLTPEERQQIRLRLDKGEKQTILAAEFGVTRQAISLLKKRKNPDGKSERFGRYMTAAEQVEFKSALETTTPSDHGFTNDYERDSWVWTHGRAHALAEKLSGEKLRKYPVLKLLKTWYPEDELWAAGPGPSKDHPNPQRSFGESQDDRPQFPVRRRRHQSIDPEFDAFLQSPAGKKIQAGAIGKAIGIFEKNIRAEHPDAVIEHVAPPAFPIRPTTTANVRIGKHKGSNKDSAKKRKKSKRK